MKKWTVALLLVLLCMPVLAEASVPYRTFVNHAEYGLTEVQPAYLPDAVFYEFDGEQLLSPSDMRLGPDGNLYICDTGNQRIVVVTREGALVRIIGDRSVLRSPKGVYVTGDGRVWVANETGRSIVVFSGEGKLLARYEKPESPLLADTASFRPNKVVVSEAGVIYVSLTGGTNGLIQMTAVEEGVSFLGFFGANQTETNLLTRIRKTLFGDAQQSRAAGVIPASVANIAIDEKGRVYTVSGAGESLIRRLNAGSRNTLEIDCGITGAAAVAVDDLGMIYAADKSGGIYQYTHEGKLLFTFGAKDQGDMRLGSFQTVSGLAVDEQGIIYVLDESAGSIQRLVPTGMTLSVREAIGYFMDGQYEQSEKPWREVLSQNSLFTYAYDGLGEALFRKGDYAAAMASFELGGNRVGYSDAFWQVRSDTLRRMLPVAVMCIAALLILKKIIGAWRKKMAPASGKQGFRTWQEFFLKPVRTAKMVIAAPADGCYEIQFKGGASLLAAALAAALFLISMLAARYGAGFLFRSWHAGQYTVIEDIGKALYVMGMFALCCYLVCTIRDGEAKWKHLVTGLSFSLLPAAASNLLLVVLTNVLTYNESVFIAFVQVIGWSWTGIIALLVILNMNAYSLRKTIQTVLLAVFTGLVLTAMAGAFLLLAQNAWNFVREIFAEGVYRFDGV